MSARPPRIAATALVMAAMGIVAGCAAPHGSTAHTDAAPAAAHPAPAASPTKAASKPTLPARLPGLGPRTLATVPANTRQAVVVTGHGKNSPDSTVVLYRRTSAGWQAGESWSAHNALRGWSTDHHAGDLRSPIGVFTLSDAGGLNSDPGSKLPYDHSTGFSVSGTGFDGESLSGSFDYVVAIDYNREPGRTPLDWTRPLGDGKGGGIWFHVDHGGPTHGCVSLSKEHMKQLLRTLDPALHPAVVMGDAASLRR